MADSGYRLPDWGYKQGMGPQAPYPIISDGGGGGEGGTNNYNDLANKPSINGKTLSGDVSLADIGAASSEDVNQMDQELEGQISAEQADRMQADDKIREDLAAETAAREQADEDTADKLTTITQEQIQHAQQIEQLETDFAGQFAGGTTGQVWTKTADGQAWQDPAGGGGGGMVETTSTNESIQYGGFTFGTIYQTSYRNLDIRTAPVNPLSVSAYMVIKGNIGTLNIPIIPFSFSKNAFANIIEVRLIGAVTRPSYQTSFDVDVTLDLLSKKANFNLDINNTSGIEWTVDSVTMGWSFVYQKGGSERAANTISEQEQPEEQAD